MGKRMKLMLGDNITSLKKLPDNSIDSVVSDPPYGLSFMNKKWDYDVPSVEFWKEVYRVLKPGGHVLSFGGTRTYHRMVVNIEDAGFEIRDQIMWLYGSGFPKSHNIGKAVDKLEGNEREVVGEKDLFGPAIHEGGTRPEGKSSIELTKGTSPYEGWGTALKPANEPICVARKPLSEKSVAENVLKWGTGGINIDGCRVGTDTIRSVYGGFTNALVDGRDEDTRKEWIENSKKENGQFNTNENEGRFPANLILECCCDEVIRGEKGEPFSYVGKEYNNKDLENDRSIDFLKGSKSEGPSNYNDKGDIHTNPNCPCYIMDQQSGVSQSKKGKPRTTKNFNQNAKIGGGECNVEYDDKGGASRFFYQAKVSKKERNMGLDGFEEKVIEGRDTGQDERNVAYKARPSSRKNTHPTVKPVSLMAYLCRLITPPNGIVLDPFMGSGSTGVAALLEGFRFCGMEMDKDYFKIAEARIENFGQYREFLKK